MPDLGCKHTHDEPFCVWRIVIPKRAIPFTPKPTMQPVAAFIVIDPIRRGNRTAFRPLEAAVTGHVRRACA